MGESLDVKFLSVDTSYEYSSLKGLPQDTIRLLELQPGDCSAALHGRLVTVRLDERAEFRALSYTWGDEANSKQIWLKGRSLCMRENLWKFLRRLRADGETGYFWADAICVNQQDLLERSSQVQLMSKIYSEARQVFAWLGDEIPDELSGQEESFLLTRKDFSDPLSPDVDPKLALPIWETIAGIICQRYWTRAWIVQEMVLSQDFVLYYKSNGRLPWDSFAYWYVSFDNNFKMMSPEIIKHQLQEISSWTKSFAAPQYRAMVHLMSMRRTYDSRHALAFGSPAARHEDRYKKDSFTEDYSLRDLVENFMHCVCSDPRDKVYALLGLATDQPITVDYTKPRAVLFWDLVCSYTAHSESLLRILRGFQLTIREIRTLIMCLAAMHRLGRYGLSLFGSFRHATGPYDTKYDEDLMNWFRWSPAEHTQLVGFVQQREEENMKNYTSQRLEDYSPESRKLRCFTDSVGAYLKQENVAKCNNGQQPEQQYRTRAPSNGPSE